MGVSGQRLVRRVDLPVEPSLPLLTYYEVTNCSHSGCPQLQMTSGVLASPSQYVLQYLLPGFASHWQLGCAHFSLVSMEIALP